MNHGKELGVVDKEASDLGTLNQTVVNEPEDYLLEYLISSIQSAQDKVESS